MQVRNFLRMILGILEMVVWVGEMGTTSFAAGRERGCRFDSEGKSRISCTDGRGLGSYFKGFPQIYRFGKGGIDLLPLISSVVRSRIGSRSRSTNPAPNVNFSRSKLEKRGCQRVICVC